MADHTVVGPTSCFKVSASAPSSSAPLQLLIDSTGPAADQVASVDSMLLFRDPLPLTNATALLSPGSDRNTRVIVFVRNLNLAPQEPASSVVVSLVDENNQNLEVPAEAVRAIANADFIQVVFRVP